MPTNDNFIARLFDFLTSDTACGDGKDVISGKSDSHFHMCKNSKCYNIFEHEGGSHMCPACKQGPWTIKRYSREDAEEYINELKAGTRT